MAAMRMLFVALLAPVLAACSSLGGLSDAGRSAGASLDPLNDDVAAMVIALDLPDVLSPDVLGPRLVLGSGPSALEVSYVFGDAEAVMDALPVPPDGRRYVVYALSQADRAKVRTALAAGALAISVVPRYCATSGAVRNRDAVGVLGILPDLRVVSLLPRETIAQLEARSGTAIPPCG